jgi:3-oxoacyl-[acyl-carrier protein] reductase
VPRRDLTDEVAIVTGATSGFGVACVRALAGEGMRVVCAARRPERLGQIVSELGEDRALAVQLDVRSPTRAGELVAAARRAFGRVDTLVSGAAVGVFGSILDHPDDALAAMIDTNVTGTLWPIRAVVSEMLREGHGGDIVILPAAAGLRANGGDAVYAATRAAQLALAEALERELAPRGIRVSAICPARDAASSDSKRRFVAGPDGMAAARGPNPDDLADAILYMLRQPRSLRTGLWTMWPTAEAV